MSKIKLKELTAEQIQTSNKEKIDKYVREVVVSCKMINYKISILVGKHRIGSSTFTKKYGYGYGYFDNEQIEK